MVTHFSSLAWETPWIEEPGGLQAMQLQESDMTVVLSRNACNLYNAYSRKTAPAAAAAKSLQSCPTLCDPIDGSPPGRQEHWSGLPFPSPMHESEKIK